MTKVVVASLCLAACTEPLGHVERIEGPRVLAARAETDADPERATPRPGEPARVRWLVADPDGTTPRGSLFDVCVVEAGAAAVPVCATPPFASNTSSPTATEPELRFTVPNAATLGQATRLALLGVVCAGGEATRAGDRYACAGATDTTRVSFDVLIGADAFENRNPDLSGTTWTLDGRAWGAGACGGDAPSVVAGGSHAVAIDLGAAARETINDGREELLVAHFVTGGELARPYSAVAPTEPPRVQLGWDAPSADADGAREVRLYAVVRDGRGGVSWDMRRVCVTR
ncbi:MAG: hypothetical protein OZ921_00650 [Sorangiineae bacterium]|nr:hypothetical protein [Polyangiaceae bacterium]MEB2320992.1 hypothetical protein [Sorangiineae bacterium]